MTARVAERVLEVLPPVPAGGTPHFCVYCNSETRGEVSVVEKRDRNGNAAKRKICKRCRERRNPSGFKRR